MTHYADLPSGRLFLLEELLHTAFWPPWVFLGKHTCELCGGFESNGEIYVPGRDVVYVAPRW